MRLYQIREENPTGEWERSFAIEFDPRSIPNSSELSRWCGKVFKQHWMLVMQTEQIVSGHMDFSYRKVCFHLRCGREDAETFLQQWRIPEEQYKKNIEYMVRRENQRQGWFEINGEKMSINDISLKLMALPERVGDVPTIKQILDRLPNDLWAKTRDDWVLEIHHILTEPVCPTVCIRPESQPHCPEFTCFGDTVEEALARSVQCVIDARNADRLPTGKSKDESITDDHGTEID